MDSVCARANHKVETYLTFSHPAINDRLSRSSVCDRGWAVAWQVGCGILDLFRNDRRLIIRSGSRDMFHHPPGRCGITWERRVTLTSIVNHHQKAAVSNTVKLIFFFLLPALGGRYSKDKGQPSESLARPSPLSVRLSASHLHHGQPTASAEQLTALINRQCDPLNRWHDC